MFLTYPLKFKDFWQKIKIFSHYFNFSKLKMEMLFIITDELKKMFLKQNLVIPYEFESVISVLKIKSLQKDFL